MTHRLFSVLYIVFSFNLSFSGFNSCFGFTIFKRKTDEEIAEDGPDNGNRKLLPLVSRHGGGLDDNDYINCNMKGWCAKISEGKTRLELMQKPDSIEEFDENGEEAIPFE